jgi:membrane fusion protein, heavy metal efflux system
VRALAILLACLVAACKSSPPTQANIKTEKPADANRHTAIVVDEPAQRKAGIVVQAAGSQVVAETVSATGEITYNEDESWTIGTVVAGRIVSIAAKVGDLVQAGQVLAQLHTHEVHDSRANYKNAVAEANRLQSALALAQRVRDRARRLHDLKAISREQLEHAEMDHRNAESALAKAQTDVDKERHHLVEFLNVPVEDQPESDFVPVRTPASGVVVERQANVGWVASPGQPVFRIANVSSLWMIANVSETDLVHLRPRQPVRVSVRAYPDRKFPGRIVRLGEELDHSTRTLRVRVLVPNQQGLLKPAMFATAEIDRPASRQVLVLPDSAIQDLNGHTIVFVRTAPDRFAVRAIETGRAGPGQKEVIAGLRENEPVVVKGSFILKSHLLRSSLEEE